MRRTRKLRTSETRAGLCPAAVKRTGPISRRITGTATQNLHPETFLRLRRVLAISPDQAFGMRLAIGIDTQIPANADTREIECIRAGLTILDAADLRLAAALLETVNQPSNANNLQLYRHASFSCARD